MLLEGQGEAQYSLSKLGMVFPLGRDAFSSVLAYLSLQSGLLEVVCTKQKTFTSFKIKKPLFSFHFPPLPTFCIGA